MDVCRTGGCRAALTPYVRSAVAYDVDLGGPGVHRGLPSTGMTFVLPVGEPLDVGWADDPESRERPGGRACPACTRGPAEIHHDGHQTGIQLELTPAGARALLGVPAAALSGEIVELGDVVPALSTLPERLADTDDWSARMRGGRARAGDRPGDGTTRPSRGPRSAGRWPG